MGNLMLRRASVDGLKNTRRLPCPSSPAQQHNYVIHTSSLSPQLVEAVRIIVHRTWGRLQPAYLPCKILQGKEDLTRVDEGPKARFCRARFAALSLRRQKDRDPPTYSTSLGAFPSLVSDAGDTLRRDRSTVMAAPRKKCTARNACTNNSENSLPHSKNQHERHYGGHTDLL
jgi:hypothetical protein